MHPVAKKLREYGKNPCNYCSNSGKLCGHCEYLDCFSPAQNPDIHRSPKNKKKIKS